MHLSQPAPLPEPPCARTHAHAVCAGMAAADHIHHFPHRHHICSEHVRPTATVVVSTSHARTDRSATTRTGVAVTHGAVGHVGEGVGVGPEPFSFGASSSHRACVLCMSVCSRWCAWPSARERASSLVHVRPRLLAHVCVWASACDAQPRCTHERAHARAEMHKCPSYGKPIDKSKPLWITRNPKPEHHFPKPQTKGGREWAI
jgi:hypothetical protein